eukprot:6388712-Alexandrium_andersonii.AAC.1
MFSARQAFRLAWAQTTYKEKTKERRHTRSWHDISEEIGEYMPLGAVVQKLGGWTDPLAIGGARRLASRCAKMGGKWCSYNNMTGLMDFLVVTRRNKNIFEEKWALYTREQESRKPPAPAAAAAAAAAAATAPAQAATTAAAATAGAKAGGKAAAAPAAAAAANPAALPSPGSAAGAEETAETPPGKKLPRGKAKAKAKAKAMENQANQGLLPPSDPDSGDTTKKINSNIRDATKLKAQILQVSAQATQMAKQIETSDDWAWARGKLQSLLTSAQEDLDKCLGSEFSKRFLYGDIKMVKSEATSAHELLTDLDNFLKVSVQLKALQNQHKRLLAMKQSFDAEI